jgi:hypothetical protein
VGFGNYFCEGYTFYFVVVVMLNFSDQKYFRAHLTAGGIPTGKPPLSIRLFLLLSRMESNFEMVMFM